MTGRDHPTSVRFVDGDGLFPRGIRTDRLRLLGPVGDHVDPGTLYEYAREGAPTIDEETRHLTWSPYPHPRTGREFLDDVADSWADHGAATYAVVPRSDEDGAGEFAGTAVLGVDWERRRGVLGIWLRRRFWGRGYSGERADALLALAFDRLDLDVVRVAHLLDNDNSRRAVERYVDRHGGRADGTFRNRVVDDDGTAHDARGYSVTATDYRAAGAVAVVSDD